MRVLVVEDEVKIAQFVAQAVTGIGHAVDVANNGDDARSFFDHVEYDLVILDVMLPDDNGIKICQSFKKNRPKIPILMLTTLTQIQDKVRGLDSGADDYMTKPFMIEELAARVRALLRRHSGQSMILSCGDLQLDVVTRKVVRFETIIKLTNKEFSLLEYFLRNIGRPLSRVQIAQHVWDQHFDPESNVVDVYVKQLRKKIDSNFSKKLIKTIVGVGYVLSEE